MAFRAMSLFNTKHGQIFLSILNVTVCPRSSDLFHIVTYHINWVLLFGHTVLNHLFLFALKVNVFQACLALQHLILDSNTVCPRSSDPFYVVPYCIKRVATFWTYSITGAKDVQGSFSQISQSKNHLIFPWSKMRNLVLC